MNPARPYEHDAGIWVAERECWRKVEGLMPVLGHNGRILER